MLDTQEVHPRNPAARMTDPDSSHEAAAENTDSGRRDAQAYIVLMAVRRYVGATSAELAAHFGLDRYMVARRLPDLEKLGEVQKGQELRVCSVSGRRATVWYPAEKSTT